MLGSLVPHLKSWAGAWERV